MENIYLAIVLAPLAGAVIAGLFGRWVGRSGAHWVATLSVAVSFLLSLLVLKHVLFDGAPAFNGSIYTWMVAGGIHFEIGFLVDRLTALMITVVTFVSLAVHIYTIGYLRDDPGYKRFFSYIALFTFAMLMLVMSNNFLQLFFGWEGVGLVSYLLIGFWYERESANFAALKAFLVNRVGDFAFVLGIALVVMYFNTLSYEQVFRAAPLVADLSIHVIPGTSWSVVTLICLLLFVGATAKSAQIPLHVWLPDSMEGPTPISALIHAATMVTAGIFMVARLSPLFEHSATALNVVLVLGGATAFFMGLVGVVQTDIKRVIAYSTISQLGYMTAALGASAYAAAIFHLMTHAFFKALLFLGAGSVIIAMHHDQDMRNMGGLRKYMPITYITFLIGALALCGIPPFSGFFSKDSIIEAVRLSHLPGAGFAYYCVLGGVFVTALYTFRMFFLVFHGKERMDEPTRKHLRESPAVITIPLIMLAIPSALVGWFTIKPILFGNYFGNAIRVLPAHNVLAEVGREFHGAGAMAGHSIHTPAFWLAVGGIFLMWVVYWLRPALAGVLRRVLFPLYYVLEHKYWFDDFNEKVVAAGGRGVGRALWRIGDVRLIDGLMVNGSAWLVGRWASVSRRIQTGFLYHYAFTMLVGLLLLLSWFVIR